MLPVLVYPVVLPALMAAIQLTTVVLAGEGVTGDNWVWVKVLVGFDIIFTSLAIALMEVILVG